MSKPEDSVGSVGDGHQPLGVEGPGSPIPVENQPGHHPEKEQDKPDLHAFAERLGTVEASERSDAHGPAGESAEPTGGRSVRTLVTAAAVVTVTVVLGVAAGRRLRRCRSH